MTSKRNIILIGPMGAGKTTVGRALARKLKLEFYDSDREIEALCGVNIPTIFEFEGEEGFRARESRVLEQLTRKSGIILATGGGSILLPENRLMLAERGIVFYLHVTLKEQFNRIRHDKNRPLLKTENPEETLRQLMHERAPIYEAVSDFRINSNGRNMRHVIDQILRQLKKGDFSLQTDS